MDLTLIPQAGLPGQEEMTIAVEGEVITLDGLACDLSDIPEGGEGVPEGVPAFAGPVTRRAGVLQCRIRARLGASAADVQEGPWIIEGADGIIGIPAQRRPEEGIAPCSW